MLRYWTQFFSALSVFLILCSGQANAEPVTQQNRFSEAVQAYDSADFSKAEEGFRELAEEGARGHQFFNLGNTFYRQGKIGEAMAAFLAARHLLPRDPDIRANVRLLVERIRDNVSADLEPSPSRAIFFWIFALSVRELTIGFAVFFGVGWLMASAALLIREHLVRRWLRWSAALLIGIGCVLGVSAMVHGKVVPQWAAITVAESPVQSGPGSHSATVFVLHEGAPVIVEESLEGWEQITLADGKKGWVKAGHIRHYRAALD